jgi:hypothetical protein
LRTTDGKRLVGFRGPKPAFFRNGLPAAGLGVRTLSLVDSFQLPAPSFQPGKGSRKGSDLGREKTELEAKSWQLVAGSWKLFDNAKRNTT